MCMMVLPSGDVGLGGVDEGDLGLELAGVEWLESESEEDENMSVGVDGSGGDPGIVEGLLV